MRDIDFGEQRQLPEMPRLKRWRLERLIGSTKPAKWETAIEQLCYMDAYRDVPMVLRSALLRKSEIWPLGIDFDHLMIGMRTLGELEERFGFPEMISAQERRDLLEHVAYKVAPMGQLEFGLNRWQRTGKWAEKVFMTAFEGYRRLRR